MHKTKDAFWVSCNVLLAILRNTIFNEYKRTSLDYAIAIIVTMH